MTWFFFGERGVAVKGVTHPISERKVIRYDDFRHFFSHYSFFPDFDSIQLDDFDVAEISAFPLLGDALTKSLMHTYPICGLCEGTEEQEMITSKVREAVAILRVNKV